MHAYVLMAVVVAGPPPRATCTVTGRVVLKHKGKALDPQSRGVIAYVEGPVGCGDKVAPRQMAQVQRKFSPPVLAVCRDDVVQFPNLDTEVHQVNLVGVNHLESGRTAEAMTAESQLHHTDLTPVTCQIHKEMKAFIRVLENRLSDDELDADGRFTIPNVPVGEKLKLVVWEDTNTDRHERKLACTKGIVDVGVVDLNVRLPAPIPGKGPY